MADQFFDPVLDEKYARGFKRLDEPARQADCDAVLDPRFTVPAYPHFYVQRLAVVGRRSQVLSEFFLGLVLRDERARIYVPRPVPSVQGYVPHPAGTERGRRRVRVDPVSSHVFWNLHCDGAVTKKGFGEGDERLA